MTYLNPEFRRDKEVKLRLDTDYYDQVKRLAAFKGTQPAVLTRLVMESLLDDVAESGSTALLDELIQKRKLNQLARRR